MNYEVELLVLPDNAKIGDVVRVVDETGELYLSARMLTLEVSVSNKTQKTTLGEFKLKNSGITEQLQELSKEFSDRVSQAAAKVATEDSLGLVKGGDNVGIRETGQLYVDQEAVASPITNLRIEEICT